MKTNGKCRVLAVLTALLMLCMPCAHALEGVTVAQIQKYGNLILSVTGSDFLSAGYTYGDIIHAEINGMVCEMPVGANYSDVDEGSMICRVVMDEKSGDDYVILAINMGDLASFTGIAQKTSMDAEPGYRWDWLVDESTEITFSMKESGGYLSEFMLRHLVRTNERTDYAFLTDEQFANFRAVSTTGMGEGVLYRSSSPVNPELGRNVFADAALANAGVRTVLNLADSLEQMRGYEGFAGSAYANCHIIPLNLGIDFMSAEFCQGLAKGLRFLMEHEGPYLVHCTEGKDRAGFVCALLECLMGASADEVSADYMTTYANYYGVEMGTEQYQVLAEKNILHSLMTAFGLRTLEGADLSLAAENYLVKAAGLSAAEILQLKERLSGK